MPAKLLISPRLGEMSGRTEGGNLGLRRGGYVHDAALSRLRAGRAGAVCGPRGRARRCGDAAAGRPVPRHGRRGPAPPHLPDRERDRREPVPAAGIHHSRLPRPYRQPRGHAAPLRLSRRGFSPAPRRAFGVFPGRHRGFGRRRYGRGRRALAGRRACADQDAAAARGEACITLGDQGVFEAVLAGLGLPRGWQMRLTRAFGSPAALAAALADLADPPRGARAGRRSGGAGDGRRAGAARRPHRGFDGGGRVLARRRPRARRDRAPADREIDLEERAAFGRRARCAEGVPQDRGAAGRRARRAGGVRPRRRPVADDRAGALFRAGRRHRGGRLAAGRNPLRRVLRTAARLLHRARLRDRGRGGAARRSPAAAATTGCSPCWGRKRRFPAWGFRCGSTASRNCGGRDNRDDCLPPLRLGFASTPLPHCVGARMGVGIAAGVSSPRSIGGEVSAQQTERASTSDLWRPAL